MAFLNVLIFCCVLLVVKDAAVHATTTQLKEQREEGTGDLIQVSFSFNSSRIMREILQMVEHQMKAYNASVSELQEETRQLKQQLQDHLQGLENPHLTTDISTPRPPTTKAATSTTLLPTDSFCTATTPYNANDPATFPLTNATVSEISSATAAQLDCSKESVKNHIVKKHNCLRTRVSPKATNMLKMVWNDEAAAKAQAWANNCRYAHNDVVTSQFTCGQNLAKSTGSALTWNRAINLWYNEVHDYVYGGANNGGAVVGHYTQVVWATSFQIGCGWKKCGSFDFYVCNYCAAGNMQSNGRVQKPYESGTPCAACPDACEGGRLCTNSCPYTNVYSNCDAQDASSQICTPGTFNHGMAASCKATCLCQGKIH